jgi:hypothetical protein
MNPYTNPYAPPQSPELYAPPMDAPVDPTVVPDAIVEQLRGTRPWVIFLAIVGLLVSGLAVLGGFGVMAASALTVPKGKTDAMFLVIGGVAYVLFGAIYVLPSVGLLRYGTAIGVLMREPRMEKLAAALDRQRWFWKAVGIMTAVMIALYPIAIIVMIGVFALKAVK